MEIKLLEFPLSVIMVVALSNLFGVLLINNSDIIEVLMGFFLILSSSGMMFGGNWGRVIFITLSMSSFLVAIYNMIIYKKLINAIEILSIKNQWPFSVTFSVVTGLYILILGFFVYGYFKLRDPEVKKLFMRNENAS